MNSAFLIIAGLSAVALAALIVWALRGATQKVGGPGATRVIEDAPKHLHNMMPIRQALDSRDLEYVAAKGGALLAARLKKERRRVATLYLAAIRQDFEQALHLARVIAVLSPEISGSHEYQRLKLTLVFRLRYQLVRTRLLLGDAALPQVTALGQMVTSLAGDLEAAMAALGERAALAADLATRTGH